MMCIYTYTDMRIYEYIYIYIYIYVYMYVYMCIYIYIYRYVCVCTCMRFFPVTDLGDLLTSNVDGLQWDVVCATCGHPRERFAKVQFKSAIEVLKAR